MIKTLSEILSQAQTITLDKPRRLMLTNYTWSKLEEVYSSMPGALRAFAEMNSGHRVLGHATVWLWALLQEEVRLDNKSRRPSEREELTIEDVELMVSPADIYLYREKIADTITAYLPVPDPQKPALKMAANPGIGSGYTSSSGASTSGARTSS